MFVNDDMMHAAISILNDPVHGRARGRFEKLTRERKTLLARLERESNAKTQRERETYAQTHPHLKALDDELAEVETVYYAAKDRRDSADSAIRVWQTENANARAAERVR